MAKTTQTLDAEKPVVAETEAVKKEVPAPEVEEAPEDSPEATLARLEAELADTKDKLLRQAAEFQNYRRRTLQERTQLTDQGRAQVAARMVDVLDDLSRSVEAAEQVDGDVDPAFENLRQGVRMVYTKFMDELAHLDVHPMDVVGKPFDEWEHEALMQQPAQDGGESGTVLAEIQRGYRIGDRVLRHAKVIVAQ